MLAGRLRKKARRREKWARKAGVTCYRLYDRDIPEVSLVIDRYEDRLHIAEWARPGAPEGDEYEPWIGALASAAAQALDLPADAVFLKRRERQRGTRQYGRVADQSARFQVSEGGLRFWVNLSDYVDTGLFLDHRLTRARVRSEAEGRHFLNLFAYTGTFSVYAADGGAKSTTTVDLSKTYLGWARDNLRLNGVPEGPQHHLVRADVLELLRDAAARGDWWDLVVVDPPTFSNSKRTQEIFDVRRDHVRLLRAVLRVTAPGGTVYFSTNARKFQLQESALTAGSVEEITEQTTPEDFERRLPHRSWRLTSR